MKKPILIYISIFTFISNLFAYQTASQEAFVAESTPTTCTLNLREGWNLIGCPFIGIRPNDYPALRNTNLFSWENDRYLKHDNNFNLTPGKGYWCYLDENQELMVKGYPVANPFYYLHKGWNLISPFSNIAIANIPELNTESSIFGWDNGSYHSTVEFLTTGKAYWYYTKERTQPVSQIEFYFNSYSNRLICDEKDILPEKLQFYLYNKTTQQIEIELTEHTWDEMPTLTMEQDPNVDYPQCH